MNPHYSCGTANCKKTTRYWVEYHFELFTGSLVSEEESESFPSADEIIIVFGESGRLEGIHVVVCHRSFAFLFTSQPTACKVKNRLRQPGENHSDGVRNKNC